MSGGWLSPALSQHQSTASFDHSLLSTVNRSVQGESKPVYHKRSIRKRNRSNTRAVIWRRWRSQLQCTMQCTGAAIVNAFSPTACANILSNAWMNKLHAFLSSCNRTENRSVHTPGKSFKFCQPNRSKCKRKLQAATCRDAVRHVMLVECTQLLYTAFASNSECQ